MRALAKISLGLVLGLVLAEALFYWRDHGAFAHLNTYLPDPLLGVRLQPGSQTKVQVATNPVSTVHINSNGYRGAEWGAHQDDGEVLVVGDSQVFGLGIDDGDTFSAKLSKRLNRSVLNGGVPTYGPQEYATVVEETVARRKLSHVIYTINLSNDLFEAGRPNRERHAVWDGWAVRKETAPASSAHFPFRYWLFNRSHLVLALRKLFNGGTPAVGVASEGGWRDVARGAPTPALAQRDLNVVFEERSRIDAQLAALNERMASTLLAAERQNNQVKAAAALFHGNDADIVNERAGRGVGSSGTRYRPPTPHFCHRPFKQRGPAP